MNHLSLTVSLVVLSLMGYPSGANNQGAPAAIDQCIQQSKPTAVGTRCTQDPSCVIVGDTHMLEWKSRAPAKIVVVCIHGLGLCARAYKPLAKELSAAGIDGFGVNVRGFGPDRDKPEHAKLNCEETVDDVGTLIKNIQKNQPDYRIFLLGESMGGALALRIAGNNPDTVDGIVCSAPAWKVLKMRQTAVKGVFELFLFPRSHPGPAGRAVIQQATTDPELTEHWLTDPSHRVKLSVGEVTSFLNFISKTGKYARQVKKPVLIVQGLKDRLVSPRAVARLFKNIPSTNKTILLDGKGEHLLLEEARFSPVLMEKLIGWMKDETTAEATALNIETINDQALSPQEQRLLSQLRQMASTPKAGK